MKIASIIIILAIVVAIIASVVLASQREDNDIFLRLTFWPGGRAQREQNVYYFIIKKDGTFISYSGTSRARGDIPARNFIRTIHEREAIVLSEEDFQIISELADIVVAIQKGVRLLTTIHTRHETLTLFYDENVYSLWRTVEADDLLAKLIQLSPLSIRW